MMLSNCWRVSRSAPIFNMVRFLLHITMTQEASYVKWRGGTAKKRHHTQCATLSVIPLCDNKMFKFLICSRSVFLSLVTVDNTFIFSNNFFIIQPVLDLSAIGTNGGVVPKKFNELPFCQNVQNLGRKKNLILSKRFIRKNPCLGSSVKLGIVTVAMCQQNPSFVVPHGFEPFTNYSRDHSLGTPSIYYAGIECVMFLSQSWNQDCVRNPGLRGMHGAECIARNDGKRCMTKWLFSRK